MRAVERFGLDPRQRGTRAYLYLQILRLELDPRKRWRIGRLDDSAPARRRRAAAPRSGGRRSSAPTVRSRRCSRRGRGEQTRRRWSAQWRDRAAFAPTIAADREMRRGKQRREARVMAANGTTNEERVGFIGLGIMGRPMVANLIGSGIVPTVWNRSQAGVDACTELGALAAESPRAVAEASDVLVTIVTDSSDVQEVLVDGPDGDAERAAIGGLASGTVVVDMSTISPAVTRSIAEQLRARGVAMLDARSRAATPARRPGRSRSWSAARLRCWNAAARSSKRWAGRSPTAAERGRADGQAMQSGRDRRGAVGRLRGAGAGAEVGRRSGAHAGRDQRGRSRILAALEPGPADRGARLRAGLHDPADAEGPASGAGSSRRSVAAAADTALVHQLYYQLQAQGADDDGTQALARVVEALGATTIGG